MAKSGCRVLPRRWPAPIVAAVFLAGCTSLRAPEPSTDWDVRRVQLQSASDWALRGRAAIRTSTDKGGQAALRWQQIGERSELELAGPFGAGRVELTVLPQQIRFTDADGETSLRYSGDDAAERFMQDQLGWSFPVRSARFWVLGLLDPTAPGDVLRNVDGAPETLLQHGWQVHLQRYAEFAGWQLPVKLVLENPQLRLKIVVSDWQIEPN